MNTVLTSLTSKKRYFIISSQLQEIALTLSRRMSLTLQCLINGGVINFISGGV